MERQNLDCGRWFDIEKATSYDESTRWNGNNAISVATGSQWEHERLWRTAGGRWVLESWSQWQGTLPSWELIDADQAGRWLVRNGYHDDPHAAAQLAELEVA